MKIISICGPTGVGKTKLSIELARAYNAEIISCDSMQFYKGLDIGTAKVSESEKAGIKHHLLDILEPDEAFSVADFQEVVRNKINELLEKNITPILVGGSGLFISSVLYDYKFKGKKREESTLEEFETKSLDELVNILKEKAPEIANSVDLGNRRRVLRALEKNGEDLDLSGKKLFYKSSIVLGLQMERSLLYERINNRVDKMLDDGLLEEAEYLYNLKLDSQATKAIGYKEFFGYFEGDNDLETSVELLKRNSRRFAKRQMTWFRNKMDCIWLNVDLNDFDKTIEAAKIIIKKEANI